MTDQENRPCFKLRQSFDHGYYSTDITILPERNLWFSSKGSVEIHWQSNRDSQWSLYGQRVEIQFETLSQYEAVSKLFRSLFGDIAKSDRYFDEFTILEALVKSKRVEQVVHDYRVSRLIPIAEVAPPECMRWMDDYEASGTGSCTVSCVCETPEQAQRLLTMQFAQKENEYYSKRFNAWLAVGRPVKRDTNAEPPEVLPAKTVLDAITADKERRDREAQAKYAAEQKAAEEAEKQQQETTTTEGVTA